MKKTLNINLNGRVFNIDEDAYELLENYLNNLKSYFRKDQDSDEIIRDFEARIEELFQERIRMGHHVISIEQVETIIQRMGKPEDFGERFETEEASATSSGRSSATEEKPKRRFYRNIDDKMIGGVCSGISAYFGWDPLPVRIAFFILIFVTQLIMAPIYLFLWIFMPAAITASQKLEMRGEAVTLENIGKTVSENTNTANNNGCLNTSLKFGLGCLGCLLGIPLLFVVFIVLVVLISLIFGFSSTLFPFVDFLGFDEITAIHPVAGFISLLLMVGIPLFSIVYALFSSNKKVKPLSKTIKWSAFIIWIIASIVFIISGTRISKEAICSFDKDWNFSYNTDTGIVGSGQIADRTEGLPLFSRLKIDDELVATIRIRQEKNAQIVINGDDNIIEKIKWNLDGDELKLGIDGNFNLRSSNLIIVITTPQIKEISTSTLSKVFFDNKIETTDFKIKVEGAGGLYADSLYVNNLVCYLGGVGKLELGGKANKANIKLEGAGAIDASELETDSLVVRLEGVGSIKCNPISFLNASLDGVGKISYKNEPKSKQSSVNGVGKLGKF